MAKTVTVQPSYESPLLKANHSPNQKLLKKNDFPEDLFGKLPDEILVPIVSLLTLKEAARTSVLSRRWRYLWTFTTGSLDFDDSLLLWLMEYRKVIKSYSEESDRFVRWVNEVLKLHRGPTIDEFKVCFSVNEKHFKLDIENWIRFSLRKKVKRLVLDLAHRRESIRVIRQYTLTDQFLRSYCLDSLTTLCLNSVQVTGEVLEYVLSNCPFLEVLHVEATESLVNLKPSGPLLKLKHLEIIHCFKLENFEISAVNLVSFKYYGHVARILLGDVPNIVEAFYSCAYACSLVTNCSQIPSYLFQVETLSLDLSLRLFEDTPRFPIFRNLRQLTLTLVASGVKPLRCCTSVLEASPFLHRFVVKLTYVDGPAGELKVLKVEHPHKFLSVFELRGFLGCTIDMELALYILSNAVSLQKIIIDTRDPYAEDMFWDERDPRLKEWGTARARELATRVPPWVELMLL